MKRESPKNVRRAPGVSVDGLDDDGPRSTAGDSSPVPSLVRSIPPAAKKAEVRGKLEKAAKAAWSVTRILIGVVIVVAASGGAAWGAKRYVTKSPRFAIKTVTVEGAQRLTPEDVAKAGAVNVGANVFLLDLDEARSKIEHEPYVAKATVTRRLPSTVSIQIVEREPSAIVSVGDELYLATREGEIFKQVADGDPTDLPLVTGIDSAGLVNDREGASILVRRSFDVIDQIDRSGISKRFPVQEVHLEKDGSVKVTVGQEGILLVLGDGPYKAKLEEAQRVLAELEKRKTKASILFLDAGSSPDRVVVRMR